MTGDSHSTSNDSIGHALPWRAILVIVAVTVGSPAPAQQQQEKPDRLPAAAAPAEDKRSPVEDAPVKDAPVKDAPVKDAPVKDAPVKDAPVVRAIRIGPDLTAQPAGPSAPGDQAAAPLAGAAEATERQPAVISLINGNTIAGQLRAADTGDIIRWQGDDFTEPFDLRLDAVKSVKLPAADQRAKMTGEFAIETASGDLLSGELLRWTDDSIEIESPRFGKLTLDAADLRRLYRIEKNPTLIFSSLAGLRDWKMPDGSADLWKEDGAHIWTDKPGAIIEANLGVPDKAHLDFTLSWTEKPNFVFGLAVDANAGAEQRTDGWRFEVIAEALAIVREDQDGADIAMVEGLQNKKSTRLHAYLDQNRGELHVYRPNGELLAEISLPTVLDQQDEDSRFGRAVRLIHNEGGLRLERLRISRWSGILPVGTSTPQVVATLADGTMMSAQRVQIDADQQTLVLQTSDGEVTVPLASIMAVKRTRLADEVPPPPTSLFLHDGSRISGELLGITDEVWLVGSAEFVEPVAVPRADVRTFIVMQRDPVPADPNRKGRSGRLVIGEHSLTGRLVEATEQAGAGVSCFRWLPFGATRAGSLKLDVSGKIIYRDPPTRPADPAAANRAIQAVQVQRQQIEQQNRGLNFGKLFLEKADSVPVARPVGPDAHRVHVRSGDVIPGLVDSIDSRGVRLTTAQSNQAVIAHHKVKAIQLRTDAPPPSLQEAKRKRLLTLPRLQKNSPPTHLLVSTTGDFLRCRLIEMLDQVIRVELQLEEIEIPRDRVSQIIWLHPEELLAELDDDDPQADKESRSPFRQLAQLIRQDGKRITFDPQQVEGRFISGTSDVLGDCRFEIDEIDQLILGEAIREAVSVLAYNQWQLEPAVEPLMARDLPGGAEVGSESALIGTDAPPIKLDLLDGGRFVLSECKGQIIVLDFWATWCAPCMQTMPLVEEALARFDPAQVRLVSVNLQERPEHIASVLERHEMDLTVALDIDGVAAQRYQARAIPQLVIIDREGKVARLYVGGGSQMVEEMTAAIEELLQEQGT